MTKAIAIIGSTGSIGKALLEHYLDNEQNTQILGFSRSPLEITHEKVSHYILDLTDEESIAKAAKKAASYPQLSRIIVATGMLHEKHIKPEKTFKDLAPESFLKLMTINALGPALVAKHFAPLLSKKKTSIFAALSARVGSISDNKLGGWYSYRASKAALNMLIKNLSIEHKLRLPLSCFVGLHPGTVQGDLSAPYSKNRPSDSVFTPDFSAEKLYNILESLDHNQSGEIIDWKGETIAY